MTWRIDLDSFKTGRIKSHRLQGETVCIGRDRSCDLVVPHEEVSRRHFFLTHSGTHCFLQDTSRNGVSLLVGGEWVRVHGEIGILPPVTLMVPAGTIDIDFEGGHRDAVDAESIWDQSVFLAGDTEERRKEAILVCDLCCSSAIAFEDDRMAYHLKRRLTQLAEPLLKRCRNRFFKGTGDGFLATFQSVGDAFSMAQDLAHRISRRNQLTRNLPMHFRLALHYGETWEFDDVDADLHGNDVNIAFRIESVQLSDFTDSHCDLPDRDRILCSDAFLGEIGSDALRDRGCTPVHCGSAELKGIAEPIQIVLLEACTVDLHSD